MRGREHDAAGIDRGHGIPRLPIQRAFPRNQRFKRFDIANMRHDAVKFFRHRATAARTAQTVS